MNSSLNQVRKLSVLAVIISITLNLGASLSQAHVGSNSKEQCVFAPENTLNIPVDDQKSGSKKTGGLDEVAFNKVIDRVMALYNADVTSKGGKLQVNRLWTDGTVNASASRTGDVWTVNMYGGLARFPTLNFDGFTIVMCHELGHHLGGFPRIGTRWASNEGQADYFAAMKCFRRVNEHDDNAAIVAALHVPAVVTTRCATQFKSQAEINLCERSAMAGMNTSSVLWELSHSGLSGIFDRSSRPDFNKTDTNVVTTTDNNHPKAQCRLDTMYNASICSVAHSEDFGQDSPIIGSCAEEKGDTMGNRPHCWYKPTR